MYLTYEWYFADDDQTKANIKAEADYFRGNNYQYGYNAYYNDLITEMPNKPSSNMTQEEHYFRNKLNLNYSYYEIQKINEVAPSWLKWKTLIALYHQNIQEKDANGVKYENIKYVSADGHFECVFSGLSNTLLTEENDSYDMGTYNYVNPWNDPIGHQIYDVNPYSIYKNTLKDYQIYLDLIIKIADSELKGKSF